MRFESRKSLIARRHSFAKILSCWMPQKFSASHFAQVGRRRCRPSSLSSIDESDPRTHCGKYEYRKPFECRLGCFPAAAAAAPPAPATTSFSPYLPDSQSSPTHQFTHLLIYPAICTPTLTHSGADELPCWEARPPRDSSIYRRRGSHSFQH